MAFALIFASCKSDATSADKSVSLASAKKTANTSAETSASLTDEVKATKKSDELLEIYVSPDEETEAAKEKALEAISRKKEIAKSENKSNTETPKSVKTKAPVKKPAINQTPKVESPVVDEEPKLAPTKISFDNKVHEYGMIMQGDKVSHKFSFTNTGSADLVISDVSASCGCTKPSYPFIPIAPGEKGYIGVNFDSKGKLGRQKPSVTVVSNAGTTKLYLEGFVDAERAKQPEPDAPKVEIIDDEQMDKLKEEALKTAPKEEEGGL